MMEGCSSNNGEACPPKLLDLIPMERREWVGNKGSGDVLEMSFVEKKLQLRLGLPGGGDDDGDEWSLGNKTNSARNMNRNRERRDEHDQSLLSLGYFKNHRYHHLYHQQQAPRVSSSHEKQQVGSPAVAGSSSSSVWLNQQLAPPSSFLHQFPTTAADKQQSLLATVAKESSQPCCTKVGSVDLQQSLAEKKAFSPPPPANTAVPNTSQKRTAPGPVVGWPPIRSFRKNLASGCSSSKQQQPAVEESKDGNNQNKKAGSEKPVQVCRKGFFVKINMDGVPIGRKVDLTAYDSYQRLSTAVDDLFRGLLAAQRDSNCGGMVNKQEEEEDKTITGSGEYTLVYEDNEGDRMLVGDVPWQMFVSTVKRLRVLKSSEVSALTLGCNKQEKMMQPLK